MKKKKDDLYKSLLELAATTKSALEDLYDANGVGVFDEILIEQGNQRKQFREEQHSPIEWVSILSQRTGKVAQNTLSQHYWADGLKK